MGSDEAEDVVFADSVNVVAIPIVPLCTLTAVVQPAVLYPPGNLVVVLTQAEFKISHCVAISHSSGDPQALALIHHGA